MKQFECQKDCGKCCCSEPGEYSQLFFTGIEFETLTILEKAKIDNQNIVTFTGTCPFLENKKCSIYPKRPAHCRTFPFWPEYAEENKWQALALICPGIGKGKIFTKFEVENKFAQSKRLGDLILGVKS